MKSMERVWGAVENAQTFWKGLFEEEPKRDKAMSVRAREYVNGLAGQFGDKAGLCPQTAV